MKYGLWPEIIIGLFSLSHEQNKARFNYAVARKQRRSQFKRNLNGYFGVARAQEILEEIFLKNGRGPEIILLPMNQNLQTKIIDQNALEFLAFGKGFFGDRLTARNPN